jgi:hypothetical protein
LLAAFTGFSGLEKGTHATSRLARVQLLALKNFRENFGGAASARSRPFFRSETVPA